MKKPVASNNWIGGNLWARGPPGGGAQGVRAVSSQVGAGGGSVLAAENRLLNGGPVENGSMSFKSSAAIIANTTPPNKVNTTASGDKTTNPRTTAPTRVTSSWAQLARGR